jgi:hypothetical protein
MKKLSVFFIVLCLLGVNYTNAQLSRVVSNVKKNVQKELTGDQDKKTESKTRPEPASACAQPELILDLGGKLKVDYSEITITTGDDGGILVQDRVSSKYYVVKDGVTDGPFNKGDKALESFGITTDENKDDSFILKYRSYITKTGDKYLIKFLGKEYGPYAQIQQFAVTRSKEKFAAIVIENVAITEDQGKSMEKAMKAAKSDQERMDLAMKYAQQMQAGMMKNGPTGSLPKFITNIPGSNFDPIKSGAVQFSGSFKFDDILLYSYNKITDLSGNTVLGITMDKYTPDNLFISSDNSNYAIYNYGTLTLKDNSTLPEVFNPRMVRAEGKIYLAYMFYSPKRNSIMQCRIPF